MIHRVFIFSFLLWMSKEAGAVHTNYDSILQAIRLMKDDTLKAKRLYGFSFEIKNTRPDLAMQAAQEALNLSKTLNYEEGIAMTYGTFAGIYKSMGKYDSALIFYSRNLLIRNKQHNLRGLGRTWLNIGTVYLAQSQFDSAAVMFHRALALSEKVNDFENIGRADNNLGLLFRKQNDISQARTYYEKALEIHRKRKDAKSAAEALTNLGVCADISGNHHGAIRYFIQAQVISDSLDDDNGRAIALHNIGIAEKALGHLSVAESNFKKALEIYTKIVFPDGQANLLSELAKLYQSQNDFAKAIACHLQSVAIAKEIGNKSTLLSNYSSLQQIYAAQNNFSDAYNYSRMAQSLRDSIFNEDKTKIINELQTKYETDKKNQQIALLHAQQELKEAQLARQRTIIMGSLAGGVLLLVTALLVVFNIQRKRKLDARIAALEKKNEIESIRNKISLDIHDDIGSGLTKINMLLHRFKNLTGSSDNAELKELSTKITDKSREIISGLGEIIWTANPRHDTLKSMLGFIRQYASKFFEDSFIRVEINFPESFTDVTIHPELKRNLFLAVKESLNNIVKHSGATQAMITFILNKNEFSFEIHDNGKGMMKEDRSFLSNGLISLRKRIEEVKGHFNLSTLPGGGTTITMTGVLY